MVQIIYSLHPYRPGTMVQRPPIPRNEYEQPRPYNDDEEESCITKS